MRGFREIVTRLDDFQPLAGAVESGHDERHLRADGQRTLLVEFAILVFAARVVETEHADARAKHVHRVGVFRRRLDELDHSLGKAAIGTQVFRQLVQFRLVRQLLTVEEIDTLLEGSVVDEVVDVVTEIAQHASLALDIGQFRFVCDDPFEALGVFRCF